MNETIEHLLAHTSVRNFADTPLTSSQKASLIAAAQAASSSNFLQAYSILEITDKAKRHELGRLANCEAYVATTGVFYVFVADLYRHATILKKKNQSLDPLRSPESLLVATVDTSLAAQNMVVAAESMGLGICYIGGIRNDLSKVAELLELPEMTVPLFGLTIGVPKTKNEPKPRIPAETITAQDRYDASILTNLDRYDQLIASYYQHRTSNQQQSTWSDKSLAYFAFDRRPQVKTFLQQQGFQLK
ncbi:oxygen-insensitive NADPH nitroreductase [Enterococcus faecalis]